MNPEKWITENLKRIREEIEEVKAKTGLHQKTIIVGVTKTRPPSILDIAEKAGIKEIGENRIQEAAEKFPKLHPEFSVIKRMIGHLQSNKVNKAVSLFDTIDSVDSIKLANKIDKAAAKTKKIIPILLEVNTSGESQKYGFSPDDINEMLSCMNCTNISVNGLMTVGPLTKNKKEIRKSFSKLRNLLEELNRQLPNGKAPLETLSMGMSGDYLIAVEEGSNMVRIGTGLFGEREKILRFPEDMEKGNT